MRVRQGGTAVLAKPRHKPKNDHRVSVLSVVCPTCKADVGVKCMTLATGLACNRHPSRRRMAVRLDNEMRGI